jgi:hypothetical protein
MMKTRVLIHTYDLRASLIVMLVAIPLLFQPLASAQQLAQPQSAPPVVEQPQAGPNQPATVNQDSGNVSVEPAQPARVQLPDSPGTLWSQNNAETPQQPGPQTSAQVAQNQPMPSHEPVGTAAAEWQPVTGVAASRPAGAAFAPAKQRRVRSIVIKVGALVGAGVAVGTVAALSAGSPSRPAGAR